MDTPLPPAGRRLSPGALVALGIAYFLTTFLFAAANVTAPHLAQSLNASPAQQSLILGAFSAMFAAALILCGRLGDNYGRKRLFIIGLAAVAITSLAAGFAPNATTLIVLRACQGAAAAAFAPQVLSTIQACTSGAMRRRAVALVTATAGLGFCGGQVIGGALLSWDPAGFGWRSVWWCAALIAVITAIIGKQLPESRGADILRLDMRGTALLTIALLTLLIGLSTGPALGWSAVTWALIVISVFAGIALWHSQRHLESRGGAPMLPPSILSYRPIRFGLIMALLFFSGYGALIFEYAQVTEAGLGISPVTAGLALLPYGIAFVAVSLAQPTIHAYLGNRTMMVGAGANATGALILAATSAAVGTDSATTWLWAAQPALIAIGASQALQFGPLVSTVMSAVPDRVAGLTGGLVTTTQQASLALGVATFGTAFTALTTSHSHPIAFAYIVIAQAVLALVFLGCVRVLYTTKTSPTAPAEVTHSSRAN